jgi:tetratricopeptide (TPR) repeat protein|tara:strand:- start:714 stop:1199 length:486 start_codon:yes stop_codon:yes gene_type:complete
LSVIDEYDARRYLDRAVDIFDDAIRMDKHCHQAIHNLGIAYWKLGFNNEAVKHLTSAQEYAPEEPHYNYHLGVALYDAGDNEESVKYLSKSQKARPKSIDDNYFLGKALLGMGNAYRANRHFVIAYKAACKNLAENIERVADIRKANFKAVRMIRAAAPNN